LKIYTQLFFSILRRIGGFLVSEFIQIKTKTGERFSWPWTMPAAEEHVNPAARWVDATGVIGERGGQPASTLRDRMCATQAN
jgi:hypothetical protein